MKKLDWFLLVLSAILYALPFLYSAALWWLIFIFPVPSLYITRTENLSCIHGYVWGIIVFALHLHAGIFIVANLAGDWWWIGFLMGVAMVLYQALMPAALFWCATKTISFLSHIIRVGTYKFCVEKFNLIPSSARPDVSEEALAKSECFLSSKNVSKDEKILIIPFDTPLRGTQGERDRVAVFKSKDKLAIIRLSIWTAALALFIFYTDQHCMWIFGDRGYPFMHPLLPLGQHPLLLQALPIIGKQLLLLFFLLVPASIVLVLWYKNYASILLCIITCMSWMWWGIHKPKNENEPDWYKKISSLPCMIRAHTPKGIQRILANHIKKLTSIYPEASIIIMPESSLDIVDHIILDSLHEACLQKPLHLIFGACSYENSNYYNSLYWIHNGLLQIRFDKKHTMLMTECLTDWMNIDWLRRIYFKDGISITQSCNERKLLQISESIAFVPYICSELFFNEYPDDCYPNQPIIAIINDTLLSDSYMQNLLVLMAKFKAIQWQRDIVYVAYGACEFINKQGRVKEKNE